MRRSAAAPAALAGTWSPPLPDLRLGPEPLVVLLVPLVVDPAPQQHDQGEEDDHPDCAPAIPGARDQQEEDDGADPAQDHDPDQLEPEPCSKSFVHVPLLC